MQRCMPLYKNIYLRVFEFKRVAVVSRFNFNNFAFSKVLEVYYCDYNSRIGFSESWLCELCVNNIPVQTHGWGLGRQTVYPTPNSIRNKLLGSARLVLGIKIHTLTHPYNITIIIIVVHYTVWSGEKNWRACEINFKK